MKIGNKFVRGGSFTITEVLVEVLANSSVIVSLKSIEVFTDSFITVTSKSVLDTLKNINNININMFYF